MAEKKTPTKTLTKDEQTALSRYLLGGGLAKKAADLLLGRKKQLEKKIKDSGG